MTFTSSYELPKEPINIPKRSQDSDGNCRHDDQGLHYVNGKPVMGCNVCGEDNV